MQPDDEKPQRVVGVSYEPGQLAPTVVLKSAGAGAEAVLEAARRSREAPPVIRDAALVDLALSAKFLDGKFGITLGADNLFDQYPDRVPNNRVLPTGVVNLNATNALGFSRYSPYGFNGRFVYARLGFSW